MACCEKHDRMDMLLTSEQYNDFPCGTPTNPTGEQRYCCRQCPSSGKPLELKAVWAGNIKLMSYLTPEEAGQVFALAAQVGLPVGEVLAGAGKANASANVALSGPKES